MDRDNQERRPDRGQRGMPGRFPSPPGPGGQRGQRGQQFPPGFPPQGPGPGMQGPRTGPPNFIPDGPGIDSRSGPTPFGSSSQFRPGRPVQGRELRRCMNRFTFIWLINGNSFWYFPTFIDRQFVYGFRWRRNRWEFDRINLNRIIFFRCF